MSARIKYRPLPSDEKHLDVGAPSHFIEAMRRVFGSEPWRLNETHTEKLEAMSAASWSPSDGQCPYETLVELVDQYENIEVWPEY